jgi:transposase
MPKSRPAAKPASVSPANEPAPQTGPQTALQAPPQAAAAPAPRVVLGADVGKASVMLHDPSVPRTWSVSNRPGPLRQALRRLPADTRVVCEASGGYERALLDAAAAVGLTAHRVDAARVKAFIASHGARAKTDAKDAAWLARYGAERADTLTPWQPPSPQRIALGELTRHRQDLLAERVQAKNRLAAPTGKAVKDLLRRQIAFLTGQIETLDRRIADLIRQDPELTRADQALQEVPGIGPVVARTLLALLPELGRLSAKQASSLSGLAPHPNDSGTRKGYRRMRPARTGIKPLLFMAALSAARKHQNLKHFHQRLIQNGKPKRLALAAIARKLLVIANAILKELQNNKPKLT